MAHLFAFLFLSLDAPRPRHSLVIEMLSQYKAAADYVTLSYHKRLTASCWNINIHRSRAIFTLLTIKMILHLPKEKTKRVSIDIQAASSRHWWRAQGCSGISSHTKFPARHVVQRIARSSRSSGWPHSLETPPRTVFAPHHYSKRLLSRH
jgi:hypothetical protein